MRFIKFAIVISVLALSGLGWTVRADDCVGVSLVRLKTADNIELTGLLRQPQPEKYKAGVVMVHGYSGNFYSAMMAFLPEALADYGFYTLAINMREHDKVPKKNLFEDNRFDIAAAIDEMARRGFHPIFLYGHSMGTNRVLDYLASTQDSRIAGLILTAPPGNLFEWNVKMFGQEKATQGLRYAQELKAGGKGNEWILIDLGPLGKTLYTANHLVSLRGPESFSDPFKNIARVSRPILIVHGLADRLADPETADRLGHQAGSKAKVKVTKITAADHQFRCCRNDLANLVHDWLIKQLNP